MNKFAIDIYSGCGGISAGAHLADPEIEIRYGLDVDRHALSTFARNHPLSYADNRDVEVVRGRDIIELGRLDRLDYLFAGPTCTAVSTMGCFDHRDPRNKLFYHFARLLKELTENGRRPDTVVMENVPGVVYGKNVRIARDVFRLLEENGYHVYADVLNLASLGLPQLRHRFFLIATSEPRPTTFPTATHNDGEGVLPSFVTVADAIGDLFEMPPTKDGKATPYPIQPTTGYQSVLRGNCDAVLDHWASTCSDLNRRRISSIPQGGCWKDMPADLLPPRLLNVRMTDYQTLYGRLHEMNPAYTITAGFSNLTSGCFAHPRRDGALTVREGARLQGFPDAYKFEGPRSAQYRQVGNAVPPLAMASMIRHLQGEGEGRPARLTSEFLRSGRKLPPMTSRFAARRSDSKHAGEGYGNGTYWPVGWGERPDTLPDHRDAYRLRPVDVRYRRRDEWRPSRDEERSSRHLERLRGRAAPAPICLRDRTLLIDVDAGPEHDAYDWSPALALLVAAAPTTLRLEFPYEWLVDEFIETVEIGRKARVGGIPKVGRCETSGTIWSVRPTRRIPITKIKVSKDAQEGSYLFGPIAIVDHAMEAAVRR